MHRVFRRERVMSVFPEQQIRDEIETTTDAFYYLGLKAGRGETLTSGEKKVLDERKLADEFVEVLREFWESSNGR